MARIKSFAVTEYGTATAGSLVCEMPEHATGDLLLYLASKDGAVAVTATAGWTAIQDGLTAGAAYRAMYKIAASSDETLTVGTGTAENWTVVVLCIEGHNGSTPVHVSAESAADDAAMPFAGPITTTTNADCLIIHGWFTDSGLSPTAYAPLTNVYAGDNGANSTGVAYTFQRTAGAVAAASWYGRANDDGRGVVIAINDDGTATKVPPYSDPTVSSGQVIRPLVGLATTESDSWPTTATLVTSILGPDCTQAWRFDGTSYTDITIAANDTTASDITPNNTVGSILYFGLDHKCDRMAGHVATAATGGVVTWEYWNGSAWTSAGSTVSGITAGLQNCCTMTKARLAAWAQTAVNGVTAYWLRQRITTVYTSAPIWTRIKFGRPVVYVAATAAGDGGTNPYTDACQNAGGNTISGALYGCQLQLGAAVDLDTGILIGCFRGVLNRDLAVDAGDPKIEKDSGGVQLTLYDAAGEYESYTVHSRGAASTDYTGYNTYAIALNNGAVPWHAHLTLDKSAVNRLTLTTLGTYGAVAIQWSMLALVTRFAIAGGDSTDPLNFDSLEYALNRSIGILPYMRRAGSAATFYAPLQFGGGDRLCCQFNQRTFQFPRQYDGQKYYDWNAAENVAGVTFKPKAGDVIKFPNCLFTSDSPYRWEWDAASASSGWTGDFGGVTVAGATVTLRDVFAFANMTFNNCPSFTQNGAALTNCSFSGTKVTSDDPAALSDCSFASAGTGHAIEITVPGTYAFSGNTFTGYGADGTTDAAIYNNSGGAVTINVSGGGSTPTVRNGAGASTTVVSGATVTFTGFPTGTDIVILTAGTSTILAQVDSHPSTSYGYGYQGTPTVDVGFIKAGYVPFYIRNLALGATDSSIPVSLSVDRNYAA